MKKVTGIGRIFFKTKDPGRMKLGTAKLMADYPRIQFSS